jgi:hypothetical protein
VVVLSCLVLCLSTLCLNVHLDLGLSLLSWQDNHKTRQDKTRQQDKTTTRQSQESHKAKQPQDKNITKEDNRNTRQAEDEDADNRQHETTQHNNIRPTKPGGSGQTKSASLVFVRVLYFIFFS